MSNITDEKITRSGGKHKKVDRRTIRTKRAILKALFDLIDEKDASKITITELANRADIDRKTFYLHYDSIQAVISEVEDNLVNTVVSFANSAKDGATLDSFFDGLNKTISENLDFAKYFVRSGAHTFFMSKVSEAFRSFVLESVSNSDIFLSEGCAQKVSLAMSCIASGVIAMYLKWLGTDSNVTLDELGSMARNMSHAAIASVKDSFDKSMPVLERFFGF